MLSRLTCMTRPSVAGLLVEDNSLWFLHSETDWLPSCVGLPWPGPKKSFHESVFLSHDWNCMLFSHWAIYCVIFFCHFFPSAATKWPICCVYNVQYVQWALQRSPQESLSSAKTISCTSFALCQSCCILKNVTGRQEWSNSHKHTLSHINVCIKNTHYS